MSFVNQYAKTVGLNWSIDAKNELIGGKIIISTKDYDKALHSRVLQECRSYENTAFEVLFLVPPNLVSRKNMVDKREEESIKKSFLLKDEFQRQNIGIIDETDIVARSNYIIDNNQSRLLQYESCRGLEGWFVVCLHFDDFIKYKLEAYEEEEQNSDNLELALESFEEKRDRAVYLWSLIPLTRAIDTLVITIKNKNSKTAQALRYIYELNPDFIEWIE